jgi:hypothetical protein
MSPVPVPREWQPIGNSTRNRDPSDHVAMPREPKTESNPEPEPELSTQPVVRRVASAVDDALRGAVGTIEEVAGAAVDATARRWDERPGARVRAVRRRGQQPLPMLYEEHPEARRATPHDLGFRTIDVADVAGTAVGGARQRGGDFLPAKPFRSDNWKARWQRLRSAADRLVVLPPIDVVRFGDRYWVVDGHNRVAQALYGGQLAIDATVTDLRMPGQPTNEHEPASLAAQVDDHRNLQAALSRTSLRPTANAPEDDAPDTPEDDAPDAPVAPGDADPAGGR